MNTYHGRFTFTVDDAWKPHLVRVAYDEPDRFPGPLEAFWKHIDAIVARTETMQGRRFVCDLTIVHHGPPPEVQSTDHGDVSWTLHEGTEDADAPRRRAPGVHPVQTATGGWVLCFNGKYEHHTTGFSKTSPEDATNYGSREACERIIARRARGPG